MSTIRSGLSIPELVKFIKHSSRECQFDEVQNALSEREKIMKKEIDLLENTQILTVLEKFSLEEKLRTSEERCEELEEKIEKLRRKETEERLSKMRKEIEELMRDKIDANQTIEELNRSIDELRVEKMESASKDFLSIINAQNGMIEEMRDEVISLKETMSELKTTNVELLEKVHTDQAALHARISLTESQLDNLAKLDDLTDIKKDILRFIQEEVISLL